MDNAIPDGLWRWLQSRYGAEEPTMATDREWISFVCPACRREQNFGPLTEPAAAAWERLFRVASQLKNLLLAQCPGCRSIFPLDRWEHTTLGLPPDREKQP